MYRGWPQAGTASGLWCRVTGDGQQEVVPPRFDRLSKVFDGVYSGYIGKNVSWIFADGQVVEDRARLIVQKELTTCRQGGGMIHGDGKWGLADASGGQLIAPEYAAITCFHHGLAWAPDTNMRKWCPITPDGRWHKDRCRESFVPASAVIVKLENADPYNFDAVLYDVRAKAEYGLGLRTEFPR